MTISMTFIALKMCEYSDHFIQICCICCMGGQLLEVIGYKCCKNKKTGNGISKAILLKFLIHVINIKTSALIADKTLNNDDMTLSTGIMAIRQAQNLQVYGKSVVNPSAQNVNITVRKSDDKAVYNCIIQCKHT